MSFVIITINVLEKNRKNSYLNALVDIFPVNAIQLTYNIIE